MSEPAPSSAAPEPPRVPVEVRPVGAGDLDLVLPLLQRFPTTRMSREDWSYTLFTYPWAGSGPRGHALFAEGKAVGFIGTVLSERQILGRTEKIANPSSWIVLEEFRYAAMLLLRPVMKARDTTLVNLTPSPAAYTMFARLGMKPLDEEQIVLPPVPDPVQAIRALRGSAVLAQDAIRGRLEGEELRYHRDLTSSAVARHVLLHRDGRQCYLVATLCRKRGVPFMDVQYIGDREFFWEHRLLAQAALIRATGIPGLAMAVDRRFLVGRLPRLSLRWKLRRLYRPSRDEITPEMIDGLYSEAMGLRY